MQQGIDVRVRSLHYYILRNFTQYELQEYNAVVHLPKMNPTIEIKTEQKSHLCCKDLLAPELLCDEDPILV